MSIIIVVVFFLILWGLLAFTIYTVLTEIEEKGLKNIIENIWEGE